MLHRIRPLSAPVFLSLTVVMALAFVAAAWTLSSSSDFGRMHDDTIYFSTAKALAEGRGHVLASVPGEPEQTKYPILYSWILSGVWRVWPDYPANLRGALALNLAFGALMVLAVVVLLRQLGAGRAEALGVTALFAFHPYTLYWSTQLMSDVLFGACGVGATVLAYHALSRKKLSAAVFACAVAALWGAAATRSLGAAFAVGVAAYAWTRGARWPAIVALTACLPLAASLLRSVSGEGPVTDSGSLDGFEQTLLYYTSYGGFWKLSVPDWAAFLAQFKRVAMETALYPAVLCFLLPAAGFASLPLQAFSVAVSVGVLNGVWGRARRAGLHPIYLAALAYLPLTLVWNYALMTRFWLPFSPLFLAGATFEVVRVGRAIRGTLRGPAPRIDRIVSGGLAAAAAGLLAYAGWQYAWAMPQSFQAGRLARAEIAVDKRAAYAWLAANAEAGETVVSYEDAALYLSAGLRGMRPMAFSTEALYRQDKAVLDRDIERLGDVAAVIQADYWLVSVDDFLNEAAPERVQPAVDKLLVDAPVVFRRGGVRVHRLAP